MLRDILLIDDDPLQIETFATALLRKYPQASVKRLRNESEFCAFLASVVGGDAPKPGLVIADVMLPWSSPSPSSPPIPEDVRKGGYSRAGVRCLLRFRRSIEPPVPWILFSILDPDAVAKEVSDMELRGSVSVLSKEQSMMALLDEVAKLTSAEQA